MQIPPTPTALPPAAPSPIIVPQHDIWDFADDAIALWNRFGATPPQVIQIAVIVVIVFMSIMLVWRYARSLSNERDES